MQSSRLGFVLLFAFATACSDEAPMHPDSTISTDKDMGVPDIYDAGRLGLCPVESNPVCVRASDCGLEDQEENNCGACSPYNYGVCATAMCESHPRLLGGDVYTLIAQVPSTILAKSFTGHVLASKTSGGNSITCEDVYANRVSLDEPCYNIIDTRSYRETAQVGDTYRLPFTQFSSGVHALFVVHAFSEEAAQGSRLGISCTEADIVEPGAGAQEVPGDMMRHL